MNANRQTQDYTKMMTWNLGGMKMDRLPEVVSTMPALGLADVQLIAFQEVNVDKGIHYLKAEVSGIKWTIGAAKEEGEWRGRATAVRRWGVIKHRQLSNNGLGICGYTPAGDVGVLNVDLPPRFTLNETGKQLDEWGRTHAMTEPKVILLGTSTRPFPTRAGQAVGAQHRQGGNTHTMVQRGNYNPLRQPSAGKRLFLPQTFRESRIRSTLEIGLLRGRFFLSSCWVILLKSNLRDVWLQHVAF